MRAKIENGDSGLAVRTAINGNFSRNENGVLLRDRMSLSWMAKLARHNDELIRVLCVGDSFTEGIGGSEIQASSWPALIARSIGERSAGQGLILTNATKYWSFTGTWWSGHVNDSPAYVSVPNWSGTDSSATVTVNCTNAWVILRNYSQTTTVNWTVDGGTPGSTVITPSQGWSRINIPIPAPGDHTIVFTIPGALRCVFGGIEILNKTVGIEISNIGVGGSTTEWWKYTSASYCSLFPPHLSIVFLGLNDWWQQLNIDTVFIPNLTTICSLLAQYGQVVLCTLPHAWNPDTQPVLRGDYSNAIRALAEANEYLLLDFENYWSLTTTTNNNLGLTNPTQSYHPNDYGFITMAALVKHILFPDSFMLS